MSPTTAYSVSDRIDAHVAANTSRPEGVLADLHPEANASRAPTYSPNTSPITVHHRDPQADEEGRQGRRPAELAEDLLFVAP